MIKLPRSPIPPPQTKAKEQALAAREAELAQRERDLAKRERALLQRERAADVSQPENRSKYATPLSDAHRHPLLSRYGTSAQPQPLTPLNTNHTPYPTSIRTGFSPLT